MLRERNLLKQTPIIAKNYKYRTWLSFIDNKTAIEFDNIYFNSEIEIEIEVIVDNITNNIEHLISLSDSTPLIRFEKNEYSEDTIVIGTNQIIPIKHQEAKVRRIKLNKNFFILDNNEPIPCTQYPISQAFIVLGYLGSKSNNITTTCKIKRLIIRRGDAEELDFLPAYFSKTRSGLYNRKTNLISMATLDKEDFRFGNSYSLYQKRITTLNLPIKFKDLEAKKLCVENYGGVQGFSNSTKNVSGIAGEITYRQAINISYFSTYQNGEFIGNNIKSFNEFFNFKNIREISTYNNTSFRGCSKLEELVLPDTEHLLILRGLIIGSTAIKTIVIPKNVIFYDADYSPFACADKLKTVVFLNPLPPIAKHSIYVQDPHVGTSFTEVYVPDNSIDLYRTAYNYNIPSGMIKPLSQYTKGIYNAT